MRLKHICCGVFFPEEQTGEFSGVGGLDMSTRDGRAVVFQARAVLGAFLVGTGRLDFWYVYISTTLGSVFGFMTLVRLGKYLGRKYFHDKDYRHFPKERIIKTEEWIHSHGYLVVLANRFFPGIRSVISIVTGMSMLNNHLVFLFALISTATWNLIWIYAGFSLGNNWNKVEEKITVIFHHYNIAMIIILIIIAVVAFIKIKIINKRETDKI